MKRAVKNITQQMRLYVMQIKVSGERDIKLVLAESV